MRVVRVVAAALIGADGRVLIAERAPGKPLSGRWEFPGGKLEPGESEFQALERELREEIGVERIEGHPMMRLTHAYPEHTVELSLWVVDRYRGEPRGLEGQALKWVEPGRLTEADILEADRPFVVGLVEWLSTRPPEEGGEGRDGRDE